MEEIKVPVAVPASSSETEEFLKIIENEKTARAQRILPANANIETGAINLNPAAASGSGRKLEIIAPNVAPEESPRMPESASGFLKKPCRTAALPPSNAPLVMHSSMRGSLSCRIIVDSSV